MFEPTLISRWGDCDNHEPECILEIDFSAEYLWEHTEPQQILDSIFKRHVTDNFVEQGGGLELRDRHEFGRFHKIQLWAFHDCEQEKLMLKLGVV
jgi:hypothetical protein